MLNFTPTPALARIETPLDGTVPLHVMKDDHWPWSALYGTAVADQEHSTGVTWSVSFENIRLMPSETFRRAEKD